MDESALHIDGDGLLVLLALVDSHGMSEYAVWNHVVDITGPHSKPITNRPYLAVGRISLRGRK